MKTNNLLNRRWGCLPHIVYKGETPVNIPHMKQRSAYRHEDEAVLYPCAVIKSRREDGHRDDHTRGMYSPRPRWEFITKIHAAPLSPLAAAAPL